MKVIIVGPGALGCLLAAKLSREHEVWLLDHDPARASGWIKPDCSWKRGRGYPVLDPGHRWPRILAPPIWFCSVSSPLRSRRR